MSACLCLGGGYKPISEEAKKYMWSGNVDFRSNGGSIPEGALEYNANTDWSNEMAKVMSQIDAQKANLEAAVTEE